MFGFQAVKYPAKFISPLYGSETKLLSLQSTKMTEITIGKPEESEYLPYYGKYISLISHSDILTALGEQVNETLDLLRAIPESDAGFRYAPDKWSIKELVGHVIDSERIFAYRALRFARNDKTPVP